MKLRQSQQRLLVLLALFALNDCCNGADSGLSHRRVHRHGAKMSSSKRSRRRSLKGTDSSSIIMNVPRGGSDTTSSGKEVFDFLRGVDIFGTFLFAFSGAVTAGRKGMDLLGMLIVAIITAVGGGTVRDLLIGQGPVFWIKDPIYVKTCVIATIATFILWPQLEQDLGIKDSALPICYADALCLGAFAVVGTQKAVNLGYVKPTMWIVFGLLTAVFGGITRDILCLQRPRVMYPERTMYGVPPLLGSAVYAFLISNHRVHNMQAKTAACISIFVAFMTRVMSFNNPRRLPHWKMPTDEDGTK